MRKGKGRKGREGKKEKRPKKEMICKESKVKVKIDKCKFEVKKKN